MLMQGVLGLSELDFKFALEVVICHQERNYATYCPHRNPPVPFTLKHRFMVDAFKERLDRFERKWRKNPIN
jgi:hypothetical protein